MAHSGNVITAPVQLLGDLQPVLGTGVRSLGRLITVANIKPWAKYKPVRRNKVTPVTSTDREAAHFGMSVQGSSGTAPYGLLDIYDGEMNSWSYDRPRGASNEEWFRMLDSNGYTHAPQNPVRSYAPLDKVVYDSQTTSPFQAAGFLALADSSGLSIELKEIAAILSTAPTNLYFGVALFQGTGLTPTTAMSARCEIATSDGPLALNIEGTQYSGTTVFFSKMRMTGNDKGLWTLVPFFCLGKIEQCGAWENTLTPSKVYYPIPYASISQIDVQSYQDSYVITFKGTKNNVTLRPEINIVNNGSSAFEHKITLYLWDPDADGVPAPGKSGKTIRDPLSYEQSFELNTSIPAGESYAWAPLVRNVDARLLQRGVAYISVAGESTTRGPYNFIKADE